jgi:hypothetical protein
VYLAFPFVRPSRDADARDVSAVWVVKMTGRCVPEANGRKKPDGGFVFLSVPQLSMGWWLYREGSIRLSDLRVYFACHELVSRRCDVDRKAVPSYGVEELKRLTGGMTTVELRRSVDRLERSGLLRFSQSAITFARTPGELSETDLSGLHEMLAQITNAKRKVPVPRRILRLMAGGARRGMVAAVLGHLVRGLYYRDGLCVPGGACKASWVADVFRVDERSVTRARAELLTMGWLVPEEREQWYLNRFGWRYTIALEWARGEAADLPAETRLPDRRPLSTAQLPAPREDREPFPREGSSNQKPGTGRSGFFRKGEGTEPSFAHVEHGDLSDTSRLLALFADAQRRKVTSGSESARLQFVALAEHARSIGSHNPTGLFAHLVRHKLWHYATTDDEEAARKRLDRHLFGGDQKPRALAPTAVSTLVGSLLSRLTDHPTTEFPLGQLPPQARGETAAQATR